MLKSDYEFRKLDKLGARAAGSAGGNWWYLNSDADRQYRNFDLAGNDNPNRLFCSSIPCSTRMEAVSPHHSTTDIDTEKSGWLDAFTGRHQYACIARPGFIEHTTGVDVNGLSWKV